jgi:hypothetical protein
MRIAGARQPVGLAKAAVKAVRGKPGAAEAIDLLEEGVGD